MTARSLFVRGGNTDPQVPVILNAQAKMAVPSKTFTLDLKGGTMPFPPFGVIMHSYYQRYTSGQAWVWGAFF